MRTNMDKLFSFSVTDSLYFNDKQDKIELVNCIRKEMKCKELLHVINNNFLESEQYRREKNFQRSIEKLKSAFYKTMELKDVSCMKCSELFRSTITDSLKGIKVELGKMTTGFFGDKNYQSSYILVNEVLQELEKGIFYNSVEQNNSNDHFIGSYLKKKVS